MAVEVWQRGPSNQWGTSIRLSYRGHEPFEIARIERDAIIGFVHVYWSSDEKKLGVFAAGYNYARIGYDVENKSFIPFDRIKDALATSIAESYKLPPGTNALDWATTRDAYLAFVRRYPNYAK